jgi:hypothetical protein
MPPFGFLGAVPFAFSGMAVFSRDGSIYPILIDNLLPLD